MTLQCLKPYTKNLSILGICKWHVPDQNHMPKNSQCYVYVTTNRTMTRRAICSLNLVTLAQMGPTVAPKFWK